MDLFVLVLVLHSALTFLPLIPPRPRCLQYWVLFHSSMVFLGVVFATCVFHPQNIVLLAAIRPLSQKVLFLKLSHIYPDLHDCGFVQGFLVIVTTYRLP